MKNIKLIAVFTFTLLTFLACSSAFEVNDRWRNDNFKTLEGQKILVVYKTDNMVAKQRFEIDVANELRSVGVDATEGFKAFPELMHKQALKEKDIEKVVKMVLDAGYHGVVISALKDQSQQTESTTTGGYTTGGYGGYGYPGHYGGYYGGFGSYYGSGYGYGGWGGYGGYGGVYVPQETTTRVVDVYLFETLMYNLDLSNEQQLVGVVSVKLTDPNSYSQVAGKYAKTIAEQFVDDAKTK